VEAASGASATDALTMQNGATAYVAVFNFGGSATTKTVSMARAGLDPQKTYTVTDLTTGTTSTATGNLSVPLDATDAKVLSLQ
jgi:hypothetical protein